MRENRDRPVEEIADHLAEEVIRGSESGRPEDDATFLVVKVM